MKSTPPRVLLSLVIAAGIHSSRLTAADESSGTDQKPAAAPAAEKSAPPPASQPKIITLTKPAPTPAPPAEPEKAKTDAPAKKAEPVTIPDDKKPVAKPEPKPSAPTAPSTAPAESKKVTASKAADEEKSGDAKKAPQEKSTEGAKSMFSKQADEEEEKPKKLTLGKTTPFSRNKLEAATEAGGDAGTSGSSKSMKATPAEEEKPRALTLGKAKPFGILPDGDKADEPEKSVNKPKTSIFKASSEPEPAVIKLGKARPFGHFEPKDEQAEEKKADGGAKKEEPKEKKEDESKASKADSSDAGKSSTTSKVDTTSPSPMSVSRKEDEPDDVVKKITFAERKAEQPTTSSTKPITFKRVESAEPEPAPEPTKPQEEKPAPAPAPEPATKSDKPTTSTGGSGMPSYKGELHGSIPVRVRNPNDFKVTVGLRSGGKGKNFRVAANDVETVTVPNGPYEVYFQYSNDPDSLYKGDEFTLRGVGVQISIVKQVNGNFAIQKVR